MSEYYGVSTPTSDFLAHYGVRGMKWGVRKARETGNVRRLSRNYNKAVKKLAKLKARTDRDLVTKAKRQNLRDTPKSALAGGLASGLGTFAINGHLPMASRAKYAAAIGGGMALANGIAGGIENARYKRMLSQKGRQKNEAKRREFEQEAKKAFKGTKYARTLSSDAQKRVEDARTYYNKMASGGTKRSMTTASQHPKNSRPKTQKSSSNNLRAEAMAAGRKRDDAYNNLSALGKHGFGKTAKAYREASRASAAATSRYYDSLNKKQYARLRRNHRG